MRPERIPLFPLNVVLLPGAELPLHIFEPCHTLISDDYPKNLEGSAAEDLSYLVAATLPMDLLWKQQILELRSEADRQERLVAYLREWAPHLQKSEAMRQRAGGNGHGLN